MAMSLQPMRCNGSITARISLVAPLLLTSSATSSQLTIPRSPCTASTALTNSAGVPVEAKDEAILRPISPVLPIPITTTFPLQAYRVSTTAEKCSSMFAATLLSSPISCSKISFARCTVLLIVVRQLEYWCASASKAFACVSMARISASRTWLAASLIAWSGSG